VKADATPTLILVHGAFHGPGCWADVLPGLEAAGIEARSVDLPSGAAAEEGPTLHDDGEAIRREIEAVDGPPFASRPDELVEILVEAAREARP
jgi:hypothetical protein